MMRLSLESVACCLLFATDMVRVMKSSFAWLDAFARGQIIALANKGYKPRDIGASVVKKDKTRPTLRAVRDAVAKWRANPEWRGENKAGPGRPRIIDAVLQKRIVGLVFKERGSAVVTIKYMKKKLPKLRRIPRWTISRSLHCALVCALVCALDCALVCALVCA